VSLAYCELGEEGVDAAGGAKKEPHGVKMKSCFEKYRGVRKMDSMEIKGLRRISLKHKEIQEASGNQKKKPNPHQKKKKKKKKKQKKKKQKTPQTKNPQKPNPAEGRRKEKPK